jgi:cell division protein ZapD
LASKIFTYEQPLNERIRSFLRLEFLFEQAGYFLRGAAPWSSHACLASILEIQNLLGRNDVKTEVLKELERHTSNLARLEQNPGVDRQRLAEVLDELDSLIDRLYSNSQPLGQELKQNEFLNSVRQRLSIPGGTCDFDLPGLHHWLQSPNEQRIRDLGNWLAAYDVLHQAITLMLHLVRESSSLRQEVAADGFYQKSLDPNNACQMLRISIPAGSGYYPEVSGGKHRFSIRFMRQSSPDEKPTPVHQDIPFQLECCIL